MERKVSIPQPEVMATINKAQLDHLSEIKTLADSHRHEIGFITRAKLQEVITQGRIFIAIHDGKVIGFVSYRHRKIDRQTTLSEICVAKNWRGQGCGRKLIDALRDESSALRRTYIQLKCPVDLPANEFYLGVGFALVSTEPGKLRPLNVWRLSIPAVE